MPTGMYKSIYERGKEPLWKSHKGQTALALAVSLWIAGGGVAWAGQQIVNDDTTISDNQSANYFELQEGVTFTVEGPDGQVQYITGAGSNTINILNGGVVNRFTDNITSISGGDRNNIVNIGKDSYVDGKIYGGRNMHGVAANNSVIVEGKVMGDVYGGYSVYIGPNGGGNRVEVLGGEVNGNVYGDFANTSNNTVLLHNAKVYSVYGSETGSSYTGYTGATLILSGSSTVIDNVGRFQTIKFDEERFEWDPTKTVLKADRYNNGSSFNLDVSAVTAKALTPGTMTLLKARNGFERFFTVGNMNVDAGHSATVLNKAATSKENNITIDYNNIHTVSYDSANMAVNYTVANNINKITLGEIAWVSGRTVRSGKGYTINSNLSGNGQIDVSNFNLKFAKETDYKNMYHQTMTLIDGLTISSDGYINSTVSKSLDYTVSNGANIATNIETNIRKPDDRDDKVDCCIGWVGIRNIDLANWDSTKEKFTVPSNWSRWGNWGSNPVTVAADFTTADIAPGTTKEIVDASNYGADFFSDANISGTQKYKAYASSSDTASGVTLTGSESKGVQAADDGKKLVYARSDFNVNSISFGEMEWGGDKGRTAAEHYDYSNVTDADIDVSGLTFKNPEDIDPEYTVSTLLAANNTLTAALEGVNKNTVSYSYSPASGVTVDGRVTGNIEKGENSICYRATGNSADKLTFGNVEWKDTGALMERPSNISFTEAAVDTSNINFTNIKELDANKQMTLVSNIGDRVGSITGTKYKVGSTMQGEGSASIEDNHLVFKTSTAAEKMELQEQTHNTVMMEEVDLEALSTGDEFIAEAERGLALAANTGADGIASFATMGGGAVRQETGSHVDTHTWNAILAIGRKNDKEKASFEYGGFFEYGRGNYTTHNGDERGDGSMHYAGGGVLAKWQKKDGFYVEGSLRMGNVHEDAKNVLRDAAGVPYSYDTDAPYWGVHVGAGKEITLKNGNSIDIYGKYFFNRRDGVSFDAGGHYDLDAITSQIVSVGARYNVKREKWNFYGGLAYEHELDGKASGKADGMPIRGADTSGGSLRAEIGTVLQPDKNLPWKIDLNLSTYAGKKRGFTGGVSVALMF